MAKPGNLPMGNMKGLGELWARLRFLLLAIVVYRIGTHIPLPGIDPDRVAELFTQNQGTILGLFNMFSGGALERMSILALGIMPYISASIIMQLMSAVTPSLEQLKKEGEAGRRKIQQYTRYLTVGLALVQAIGMSVGLQGQGLTYGSSTFLLIAVPTLVCGAVFMMWLGEQINEHGIGNGISMLIFAGIVAGLPAAIGQTIEQARTGQLSVLVVLLIAVLAIAVVYFVVFVERAQRRIPVSYARRNQAGSGMMGAQSSHLPLKLNQAGVIPAIFASSLLLFPASLATWFGQGVEGETSWLKNALQEIALAIGPGQPLYLIVFAALIIFFCFFYTALVFNPKDMADNLKRGGAYIPGIRPGEQTAKHIDDVMTRLTMVGSLYMTLVCLLPLFLAAFWNVPFYLGGTSLLIAVVVTMDFMQQVQAHLMSHQYDSLMKKANFKG